MGIWDVVDEDGARWDVTNARAVPLIPDEEAGGGGRTPSPGPLMPADMPVAPDSVTVLVSAKRRGGGSREKTAFPEEGGAAGEMPRGGVPVRGGIQGVLFEMDAEAGRGRAYRGTVARSAAGITYRQLDYWARRDIVPPSVDPSHGSGTRRLYSFTDIVLLAVAKHLLDVGVNLSGVSSVVSYLSALPTGVLRDVTILCDGHQVYGCVDDEQVMALIHQGRALFGVAVGPLWEQVRSTLDAVDMADGSAGVTHDASETTRVD